MKKKHYRFVFLVCPLIASALLVSCVDSGYAVGSNLSSGGARHGVYSTLPNSFVGNAYYHNGQYYSGGNREIGNYVYEGKSYNDRYSHNGQYIYGGSYKTYNSNRRHSRRNTRILGTRYRR